MKTDCLTQKKKTKVSKIKNTICHVSYAIENMSFLFPKCQLRGNSEEHLQEG